jgi:dTMP kinase
VPGNKVRSVQGRFITVEGGEGVGKTTQLSVIARVLADHGIDCVMTREPGGTPRAEQIRGLLLTPTPEPMPPTCELLLMFAARATHLANVIRPALERGSWVVSDRFTDATYAYQGAARGMSMADIATLESLVQKSTRPDLTVLLDAPVDVALARARQRNQGQTDRFELERATFFERVRKGYLDRAAAEPGRFRIVDASRPLADVSAALKTELEAYLAGILRG